MRSRRTLGYGLALVLLLSGCARSEGRAARGGSAPATVARTASAARPGAMEKYVSPQANFVLYRPAGWRVEESTSPSSWVVGVTSPDGELDTSVISGRDAFGGPVAALAALVKVMATAGSSLRIEDAERDARGERALASYSFRHPTRGPREGRLWVRATDGLFFAVRCETPAGRLAENRALLLGIALNLHVMKQGFEPVSGSAVAPRPLPLATHTLPDGSASFGLPAGWTFQPLGPAQFFARDPASGASFMVATVEVMSPRMGVRLPNVPVSDFLEPAAAWPFLTRQLISNVRYVEANALPDLDASLGQVYTIGPVRTAALVYSFDGQQGAGKGFTLGASLGTRLQTNWKFWHMTLTTPAADFDRLLPTLVAMAGSFTIDDRFARSYVAAGLANLRRLEAQTRAVVTQNARDIHDMMQQAYDERQRSQDYIDYQRTSYIRGETDWISNVEGGTVYHSDAWGTKNTYTGESWEGAPFDSAHFDGTNPKHDEALVAVDSRELYERMRR